MTEPEKMPAGQPAAPASKTDARDELMREFVQTMKDGQIMQAQLLKEHTQAMIANTRSMDALYSAIVGDEPSLEMPEGTEGLIDVIDELREVADPLLGAVTASNINFAQLMYVLDRSIDIYAGDPEASALPVSGEPEPGVVYKEGRTPVFKDVVAALRQFRKEAEEEEKQEAEEEARLKKEEEQRATPTAPAKPTMMGNKKPALRALPPLPVVSPRPVAGQKAGDELIQR